MFPGRRGPRAVSVACIATWIAVVGCAGAQPRTTLPGPRPATAISGGAGVGVAATGLRPGDRILLAVEGERALSDTFTVGVGPSVELPVLGTVSLAGVPRRDVERHLTTAIAAYVRAPTVHARALVRIGVIGEVARPGFYALPYDAVIADALTAAGGLTRDARVPKIRLERGGAETRDADAIRLALERGATLDEVGVAGGDQIVVPRNRDTERIARIVGVLITIPAAIIALTQLSR
jgi:polysaccharide export outer membrane protein